jgi:hypothetical protein
MNKAAIICKLHAIADRCLLEPGNWPANRECLAAFHKTVRDLGLDEDVPDSPGSTRSTPPLGTELQLDMLMVFVGAREIYEIPYFLETYGYIEESEADEIWSGPPTKLERTIHRHVLRAYFRFCNRVKPLN